jgi:hypothetical protein
MKKMKLVPADVRVKQIQSELATRYRAPVTAEQATQTAAVTETQTEHEATPTMDDKSSQTNHLYNHLIRRYAGYVDQVTQVLKAKNFKWYDGQLKFRDPPDVPLLPTIEHLARNFMRATDPAIFAIEDVFLGRQRRKRKPTDDEGDGPPPRLSPIVPSAQSQGRHLHLSKPFPE